MENNFFDLASLREDYDLELKLAEGEDKKGKLPKSFWETYSALANTEGGYVILGAKESEDGFLFPGIQNPDKVVSEIWNGANNRDKTSENILRNQDVRIEKHGGIKLVVVRIPQADRKQKPVFINNNPLKGTYRRNNEGDYHCPEHIVKQMLGEQMNDTRDSIIFEKFDLADIDRETLKVYRQHFSNRKPEHPFNDCGDLEFLRQIGGYAVDRNSGKSGLTLAGLLMFGKLRSILDAVPNYIVDYQRLPREAAESRWLDRITTDFTWSGNIYDFYRMVSKKLFENLKTPFQLKGDERIEDTPVHEALREAFVNALVHADYSGNCSVLVIEKP
ncbi:MAG: RNA-binding domain-containing protein, partial [Victivallales bacterium]